MRSRDPQAVVKALSLRTVLESNWRAGLGEVQERGVFVTPSVDGWVFAIGPDLRSGGDDSSVVPPLLERLSRTFGRAAWFATHGDADHHGWAVAENGVLQRGYAFAGEHGHVFWHGEVTAEERALGCFVDDPRDQSDDEVKWWPDEGVVMAIAAAWTLDPSRIGERGGPHGCGWVGRL